MTIELPTSIPTDLPPLTLAMFWAARGFRVLPVHRKQIDAQGKDMKAPILKAWQKEATTDLHTIMAWPQWKQAGTRVGLATGPGTIDVFDEDVADGKPGVETRRRLVAAGLLDPNTLAVSRTPSGGKHYWGVGSTQRNAGWSEKHGADFRGDGGFVLAPGNEGYDWVRGPLTQLGTVDWEAIKAFLEPPKVQAAANTQPRPGKLVAPLKGGFSGDDTGPTPSQWFKDNNTVSQMLLEHGWKYDRTVDQNAHWIRPGKESGPSATVMLGDNGYEIMYVFSTSCDPLQSDHRYDAFELLAELRHSGDKKAAASAVRGMMPRAETAAPAGPPATQTEAPRPDAPLAAASTTESTPGADLERAPVLLPDEFFDGCPELEIIKQAAYSRYVSPTALAMVVLTRIASMADHRLRLPPLVGSHVGLSFYTVLTAAVGGGKSSTVNLAAELLGTDPESTREVQLINGNGTGEGLIEGHIGLVDEEGSKTKVRQQVINNAFWFVDEGMNLVTEFARRGSTTTGILCSGWFSAGVATNNASEGLNRRLAALSYNWGILIAIQDENAHHLLAQQGIGLTQRCFWVTGNDPTIPDPDHKPEWPGSLDWRHPAMPGDIPSTLRGTLSAPVIDDNTARVVVLPAWYAKEMEWGLWEQKSKGKVDELSEHIRLMEIKLATHIGMLRGRLDPTDDDIRRARIAINAHKKQIRRAANRTRLAEAENERITAKKAVERAETRAEELDRTFRDKVRSAVDGGRTTTWRKITQMMRGPARAEMGGTEGLAEILSEMLVLGEVRALGGTGGAAIYGCGQAVDAVVDGAHML